MKKLVCMICGMTINEKNYNFNKEAFIKNNSEDNIAVCPFCGVSVEYLKEYEEKLNFKQDSLNEKEIKILDHAVKLEIFNGDFYKKAVNLTKNKKLKEMFAALSNIEYMHANVHKRLGGFKEMPVLREMDYSMYSSDQLLLDAACKREKHAVQYYDKYSKIVKNELIKKVFTALRDVEKVHVKLTNDR